MSSTQIRRLTYAAMYLAIALVLPSVAGHIPQLGQTLLPMHIPALLCGFLCGWPWGMAVGFLAPLLSAVTGVMPMPLIPNALAMALEMAVYGGASGLLRRVLPRKKWAIYVSLIIAMIAGRLVWGAARLALMSAARDGFTWGMFLAGAVLDAVPGIILQIILIPLLVMAMEKAGLSLNP